MATHAENSENPKKEDVPKAVDDDRKVRNCIESARAELSKQIDTDKAELKASFDTLSQKYDGLAKKINEVIEKLQEKKTQRANREAELLKELA